MSDRIYTIQAREVVPGMLVDGHRVTGIERTRDDAPLRIEAGPYFWMRRRDAPVEVALPGPSPRELLCACQVSTLKAGAKRHGFEHCRWTLLAAALPWPEHDRSCPVHRLRLRLWPVGATWIEHAEIWLDGVPSRKQGAWHIDDVIVWPVDVRTDFAGIAEPCADSLRASLCEPEVTL